MLLLQGSEGVGQAAELLRHGECVALPTETVYGLAADAADDAAVAKIFEAKGRPTNHPLIVHIPSPEHLDQWALDLSPAARLLAAQCWPGPLTMLLKKSEKTSDVVTGGLTTVGLRVPSHPLFLEVLSQVNTGLAAPSANRYKQLSPTTAQQVIDSLEGRISAVLDGGPCEHGLESTIVDMTSDVPRILRAGPLSRKYLEELLGQSVEMPLVHNAIVPGNVSAHYQPRTPLRLMTRDEISVYVTQQPVSARIGLMVYSRQLVSGFAAAGLTQSTVLQLPEDSAAYGQQLYGSLHLLDQQDMDTLLVEKPPADEAWSAVNDRLTRASA